MTPALADADFPPQSSATLMTAMRDESSLFLRSPLRDNQSACS